MKYIFIDTDNGVTTPSNTTPDTSTSKYHTTGSIGSFPASGACWNDLRNAFTDATITALTDDITFFCKGSADDTNASSYNFTPAVLAASITITGDCTTAAWDSNKYTLSTTNSSQILLGFTYQGNVTVQNIQLYHNGSNSAPYALEIAPTGGTATYTIRNVKSRVEGSGTGTGRAFSYSTSQSYTVRFINCTAQQVGSPGGRRDGINGSATPTVHVYNCAIEGFSGTGAFGINNTDTVTNCAVFNNTDDFGASAGTISYCASDDGDGTNAQTGATWANEFNAYTTGDFTLLSGSTKCKDNGLTDPASGLFSDDITGATRSGSWDIGPSEYASGGGGTQHYFECSVSLALTSTFAGLNSLTTKFVLLASPSNAPGYITGDPALATGNFLEYDRYANGGATYEVTIAADAQWSIAGSPPDGNYYFFARAYDMTQGPWAPHYVHVLSAVTVTDVNGDERLYHGGPLNITCTNAGTVQGKVFIGSTEQTVTSWGDTSITGTVVMPTTGLAKTLTVVKGS